MGCGASKESTEIAVASTCSRAEQRRQNQQLTGRSPSPGSRSQIVPSVRDSSSSPQPATADPVLDPVDPSAAKPGSDLAPELAAGAPVLDLPSSAAEVVENTVVDTAGVAEYTAEVTADVVEQTAAVTEVATAVVEYTTEVVEHTAEVTGEFVKYTATTTTTGAAAAAAAAVRAPSPPPPSPPSPHLCYSCQSVIDKLDDTNVAVTINFSTSSLLAAKKNRLSRTPSPAPRPQPGDSRASTPKSNRAPEPIAAAAAAAAVVPVEFRPPEEDQVATSVSAAESRASSRVSSPVSAAAAANPAAGEREKPDEITSFAKLSRTPSPAPRPIVSESRSSTPKFASAESRSSSPAPVAVLESKASSRAPSPHAETESRASSPRQLLNSFRKHVSRSPSPGQVLTQTSRHSSPAAGSGTGSEIAAKRHSSRSASPAPPPPPPDQAQVVRKQNLPADFPVDGFSKSSSRASIASLKDSKSCSPAASERNLKASSYSPSPPAESGASSKSASPAVSRRASFGVGDDDNEFLSASAAAALKAIVQRVTSEYSEKSVVSHREEAAKITSESIQIQAKQDLEPGSGKDSRNNELSGNLDSSTNLETLLSCVESKKQSGSVLASPKLGSKNHSPRPGLYEYYLGLRSGEYNMSPPSSSTSSQNDALASIKDALDEIDISKDLVEENTTIASKVSSPSLDVESIYNEIRKLTFSEYDKLEQNDDNSSVDHETEMVNLANSKSTAAVGKDRDRDRVTSPLSSKGSVEEGIVANIRDARR